MAIECLLLDGLETNGLCRESEKESSNYGWLLLSP